MKKENDPEGFLVLETQSVALTIIYSKNAFRQSRVFPIEDQKEVTVDHSRKGQVLRRWVGWSGWS